MNARHAACALIFVAGCGWDGIFLTPRGFDPTEPLKASLTGSAQSDAHVEAMNRAGDVIASAGADGSGRFELILPAGSDTQSLRVLARSGASTLKTIVSLALPGEATDVGTLDVASTARAQLATYEIVQEAGSSFRATPPRALEGLLVKIGSAPTAEFDAFAAVVREILDSTAAAPGDSIAPFDLASADLAEAYLMIAGLPAELLARYRTALGAAAAGYGLEIRCDPSRLNTMFTVDMSGRGLDGNGTPQLIRQPAKEGRVFIGFTSDESSAVSDDSIPRKLTPNDARFAMTDDGQNGDELAGDQIFTVVVPLPRGARLLYKYTDGAAGEGFTGSEEWPGNARIIEIEDVLTGRPDGEADCLIIRRDSFGDEASNKNFVNLHAKARERGGTLSFDSDLGGPEAPEGRGVRIGGLFAGDVREFGPLTPLGVPEARENGACTICPAPLVLDPDDETPPELVRADRLAVDRVRVRFSEPIDATDARAVEKYLYVDEAGSAIPVSSATPSGADVLLVTAPAHPRAKAHLRVRSLRDASVRGNVLEEGEIDVGPDLTAPKVLSARALSILELDPNATVSDPTVGDLVELVLDERPEESSASDVGRFRIDGLTVLAAVLLEDPAPAATTRIRLVTEPQTKSAPYAIAISGLRDAAGNALDQEATFDGFALYRVRFSMSAAFAYKDGPAASRGVPRGEALYLTGTPLTAARDLTGHDISIVASGATRSDVTGWPQFEMKPSGSFGGEVVHEISMLLPPGSWSWKAAHGVEGEQTRPPPTLEKVYKTLATTNDATGVRVDPVTMIAENGISYVGASLSESGDEPPRASVVFKREAPDEVCEVRRDTDCPLIVVGAWRDFVLDQGGKTRDYDDGIITLPPHRPSIPDVGPPKLLDARARDSFSVLLSFDETIVSPATRLEASLSLASNGFGLPVHVLDTAEVKPHQAVLVVDGMDCALGMMPGEAYTVRYRGAADRAGFVDRRWKTQSILAPDTCVALTPIADRSPPVIASVVATDLTELVVTFDERVDPATAGRAGAYAVNAEMGGAALAIQLVEVLPDRKSVRLVTAAQTILARYVLTVNGIGDAADPSNVLASATVSFDGFGETMPPVVVRARAIDVDRVLVRFDEPVEAVSALDATKYSIAGLTILGVEFSGDPGRRPLAFNAVLAPRIREAVLLRTSPMTDAAPYMLTVNGVRDLSGNPGQTTVSFVGVASAPLVDVVIEYEISDTRKIAGTVPSRSISLATLTDSREGVFVLGARQGSDGMPIAGTTPPVNDALGGFGVEGQPLEGIEPRLADNGAAPDLVAGDGVFSILVPRVPLGTTIIWKAFAPYATSYRDRNPSDGFAAFADALPGPSVFADGQEYPGNENGALILDDGTSDGLVRVRALFGDEITYKKHTGGAAYVWVFDDR